MFRQLSFIVLLIGCLFLAACGSSQKVSYRYVPPLSVMDKNCAAQCSKGRRYCQQICQLKHPPCFAEAQQKAVNQYERYKQEQMRKGERVTKSLRDFAQSDACYRDCNCVPSFNTCYTACGGRVIPL